MTTLECRRHAWSCDSVGILLDQPQPLIENIIHNNIMTKDDYFLEILSVLVIMISDTGIYKREGNDWYSQSNKKIGIKLQFE